jgi:hypothetical protein
MGLRQHGKHAACTQRELTFCGTICACPLQEVGIILDGDMCFLCWRVLDRDLLCASNIFSMRTKMAQTPIRLSLVCKQIHSLKDEGGGNNYFTHTITSNSHTHTQHKHQAKKEPCKLPPPLSHSLFDVLQRTSLWELDGYSGCNDGWGSSEEGSHGYQVCVAPFPSRFSIHVCNGF